MSIGIEQDCLFEIGCEELPTASLQPLSLALKESLRLQLASAELKHGELKSFVTPRRVAILIHNLSNSQGEQIIEQLGPGVNQAYDAEGNPTPACIGFARSCGATPDQLLKKLIGKAERVYFKLKKPGSSVEALLPQFINQALSTLPIAKPMRWGSHTFSFVRPVHWAVLLYGDQSISTTILGQATTRATYGHRFHHPEGLTLNSPQQYAELLEGQGYVIPDFTQRKQRIEALIAQSLLPGEQAVIDPALLDEVTALVEWPVALRGQFKPEFLQVPQEVLIASMQTHQKCFAVMDVQQRLLPVFIVISNIVSKDPNAVIRGNERVINARLSDAAFFYANDSKQRLAEFAPKLQQVVFQQQLGSLAQKMQRLIVLAKSIANQIGANIAITTEAAALAKCDLLSEMVSEFPNLQGIMGYYYALNDGCTEICAKAIQQHYWPRFAGDHLPTNLEACALALADRLDTLVGILGINQAPTGDKDPFALRRAALGICRLLIEKELALDLMELLTQTQQTYMQTMSLPNPQVVTDAFNFIIQRLKSYLEREVDSDVFAAVVACQPTSVLDFYRRACAVMQFKQLPEAATLAAANKRVSNILKKQAEAIPENIDPALFETNAEQQLAALLMHHSMQINELCQQGDYAAALTQLATFKPAVDEFFDHVMVMVDNNELRLNRLALLAQLRQLFIQIADIALLQ